MCVNREAASASFLYFPNIWFKEEWVCFFRLIQAASLKSGTTAVANIAFLRLAHPYMAVLSTFVVMYCIGSIKVQKIWRCPIYAASSRLVMVRFPICFSSTSRHCTVVSPMGGLNTNHFLFRLLQTPNIPFRHASVPPINVGRCGLIYLKCVGLSAREQLNFRHRFSSLFTCAARNTLLTLSGFQRMI